ncbi:MAG: glycoside hydrolase family 95 protein [Xanthomonadaceae bacterium]|nr:glycoside hydrolase family 95 protein [Xanthomonadaceae bacterium]
MTLKRRELLKATAAGLAVAAAPLTRAARSADAGRRAPSTADLRLWYREPARVWVEALPVGNGRLGAMVFGGVALERLQLNEDTLYAGGPYFAINPRAKENLPRVREAVFAGRYAEAEALANATLMAEPLKQMPFQPLGNLWLQFDRLDGVSDYMRELDLDAAVARTSFRVGAGLHRREVFVSPVDQCLVMRCTVEGGDALIGRIRTANEHATTTRVDGDGWLVSGRNVDKHGIAGRLRFAFRVQVRHQGGRVRVEQDQIVFDGVRELELRLVAATSYVRYDDVSGDPDAITARQLALAQAKSFAALQADHLAEHRRLFHRVRLDLGRTAAADQPTDERIAAFAHGDDPALVALYHAYGRYLLICSSRPGTQPANLQGIWNDLMDPPWESKYTINVNTEMNYWPAEANALAECVEPLERMIGDLAETGARMAREMYGAPGWMAHHNTDLWRQTGPIDGAQWGLWPMGGAWLLQQLWDRWDYGRDPADLRRLWPWLRGAAAFFAATLQRDPTTGAMVTVPSISPENVHPFGATLCAGPTMDAQILRDLFGQCIEAAEILDVDAAFASELAALREQLPPNRIGKAGQLQEWQQDWDMQAPEIHHRHISHLYGLHPSAQINLRDTPDLARAAKRTLEIRGDDATGWGIAWRLNFWARLWDGEHSLKILRMLLSPQRSYPNLFDAHPPFQIDGNFGGAAGIVEMLVQSWGGSVFLLPALPGAWRDGELEGIRVRNAARLDLSWKGGRLAQATLHSDKGGRYQLVHAGRTLDLDLAAGASATVRLRDGALVHA